MKFDPDLYRKILEAVEEDDLLRFTTERPFEGVAFNVVAEHIRLAKEAHVLDAFLSQGEGGEITSVRPTRLTIAGHQVLAASRNEAIWPALKSIIASTGGRVSESIVRELVRRSINSEGPRK